MTLPFTNDQFFGIFAEYNRAFVLVAALLWLTSILTLAAAARNPARHSRTLSYFLSALWLWNSVAYHGLLFTRINPAAWLFAALFLLQGLLLFRAATRGPIKYFSCARWMRAIGVGLISYALAYPFLTMASGHSYPATPTFGIPCPTAILTIGIFLTARAGVSLTLAIIPIVWAFIGGSAAVLLEVPTDFVLLGAGLLLTAVLAGQRLQLMRAA